jgi:hypothetical protein
MWTALATDIVGILALAYGTYFRRYYRRDLLLAYIALNVGVFAVTATLADASSGVGLGLGLGLFGILSIIRLRSDAITQEEVAYYFVSLALGLIAGLHPGPLWLAPTLMAMLVLVMVVADAAGFATRTRRQTVTLDRAYADESQLRAALERLLGGEVKHIVVYELDMVRDTTEVDVRFRVPARSAQTRHEALDPVDVPALTDIGLRA